MRILLSGLLLMIAVPVLGLPYTWDRLLYIVGIGLMGFGIFAVFFNGKEHYEGKREQKTEEKEKKNAKKKRKKITKKDSEKSEDSEKEIPETKDKKVSKKKKDKSDQISILTDEEKEEISRSVRES